MLSLLNHTLGEFSHSRVIELSQSELKAYNQLVEYLEQNKRITTEQFSNLINKAPSTTRRYLSKYNQLDLVESHGQNKNRFYTI